MEIEEKKKTEEVEGDAPDCSEKTSGEEELLEEEEMVSPELEEASEDKSIDAIEAKAILDSVDDEIEDESEITSDEINDERMSPEILEDAIRRRDVNKLRDFLTYIPDVDIAQAASELEDIKDLIYLFRHTPSESAAVIFDELPDEVKEDLVTAMSDRELIRIINESSVDDVADTVDSMPANIAVRILKAADKDMRADLNKLLKYEDDTAGAIMTTEFLEFKSNVTVSSAIETIRKIGRKAETVYTIFVRNDKRKFVGTVDLDDLIFASGKERLYEIMAKDAPFVHVNTDKEEVANMMAKYNLHALAVLNDDDCLTGIVTIDDAIDVAVEEANEDIEKMNAIGTLEHSYLETKPISMAKKCVPWIIVLLVLGTFSSMVLSIFQDKISALPVLAAFIPVLMDTGGNAGGQTIALMIRGLALKEFGPKDAWKIIRKEALSALIISACVALFAFLWFTMEQYTGIINNTQANLAWLKENGIITSDVHVGTIWNGECWGWGFAGQVFRVSGIVSLTLFITTIASKLVAVLLPIGASAIKKDPAIVSQPILTTIIDVISLVIFFVIAETMILAYL
ncbi:MAG: magnesium transporter [Bacilli bacterium]|nr:magnesium transporter [Bacilli bacterium]